MDPDAFDKMTEAYTAAWNSGNPEAVADHFATGKGIRINRGENQFGRDAMINMAGGFMASFPDLKLSRDFVRLAGDHAVYGWTLEGHHAETGNFVTAHGWEEWDLDENGLILNSLGWFDALDYDRQVDGRAR